MSPWVLVLVIRKASTRPTMIPRLVMALPIFTRTISLHLHMQRSGTVAVFRVVSHGEENLALLKAQADDPVCTTRLVVADDALAGVPCALMSAKCMAANMRGSAPGSLVTDAMSGMLRSMRMRVCLGADITEEHSGLHVVLQATCSVP